MDGLVHGLEGAAVGVILASLVDATVLAWDPKPATPGISMIVPTFGPTKDGFRIGIGGTF